MANLEWAPGKVTAAEGFLVATPRLRPQTLKTPIIFCPQAGGLASFFLNSLDPTKGRRAMLVRKLADDLQCVCVSGDFGGQNTFGNDTVVARIKAVYDWLQTRPTVRQGQVLMVGTSMGNLSALNFARAWPGKVKAILSFFGLTDLVSTYENNVGGLAVTIGNAWGVVAPADLPSRAAPMDNISELDGLSWLGFSGNLDALVSVATQQAFVDAVNAEFPGKALYINTGVTDHDDTTIDAVSYKTIKEFLSLGAAD